VKPTGTWKSASRVYTDIPLNATGRAQALLAAMGAPEVPVYSTWRLNERHYGAQLSADAMEHVEIAPGVPLIYRYLLTS